MPHSIASPDFCLQKLAISGSFSARGGASLSPNCRNSSKLLSFIWLHNLSAGNSTRNVVPSASTTYEQCNELYPAPPSDNPIVGIGGQRLGTDNHSFRETVLAQPVIAQGISLRVKQARQFRPQFRQLLRLKLAFKHTVLNSGPKVLQRSPEVVAPFVIRNIVTDNPKHQRISSGA